MNKYKKLGKNVVLLTIGNFASRVLSFFLVPLYTSVLSTDEYGTADLITTSVNLIMPIFTCLIYEAVLRFALDKEENKKQVFSIGFWITCVGSFIVIAAAQLLRINSTFDGLVWLFVFYYITLAFYNLILQYVKGKEEVGVYAVAGVLNTFTYIICNILFLVIFKIGVKGYLLSFIIGHAISSLFAFSFARVYKDLLAWTKLNLKKAREMLTYSVPMIPNSISWWVSDSSDKYILVYFWGTAVNGIYSVAYKIPSILSVLVTIFIGAWQISAVEDFGSEESRKFYSDIYAKYEAVLIIGASVLIAGTKVLASFLYSNDFYSAWLYTPVLLLASIFNSLAAFYGSIYTSAKKTKMLFYSTVAAAIVNITLNLLLIPQFDAMGAAVATCISYIVVWIWRVVDSRKIITLAINYKKSIVGFVLVISEAVIVCISNSTITAYSIICVLVTIIIYRDFVKEIFCTVKDRAVRRR